MCMYMVSAAPADVLWMESGRPRGMVFIPCPEAGDLDTWGRCVLSRLVLNMCAIAPTCLIFRYDSFRLISLSSQSSAHQRLPSSQAGLLRSMTQIGFMMNMLRLVRGCNHAATM